MSVAGGQVTNNGRNVRVKRVYVPPDRSDGLRVLVDRIWPRGVKKDEARVDLWLKEIAPSSALRKWFGHEPARWDEFQKKYRAELRGRQALMDRLREALSEGPVTLLFAARDEAHNNAVVLRNLLVAGGGPRRLDDG